MNVVIRSPEPGETPLSDSEKWVAIRDGIHRTTEPTWHPAIARNWSILSAKVHRAEAIRVISQNELTP